MEPTEDIEKLLRDAHTLIVRYTGTQDPVRRLKLARTMFTKGALLIKARRFDSALAAFDLLLRTFPDNQDDSIAPQVAKTLLDRAAVLDVLGRHDDALIGYDELIRRFRDVPLEAVRGYALSAEFNKASLLARLNRHVEALASLDECLDNRVQPLPRLLAKILWMQAESLEALGRHGASLAACEQLITRFSDKPEIVDHNWLGRIVLTKMDLLIALDRVMEILAAYQTAREQFGITADEVTASRISDFVMQRLKTYMESNQPVPALALAEETLRVLGHCPEMPWVEVAQSAAKTRIVALCRMRRVNECIAAYDVAMERFADAVDEPLRLTLAAMLLDQSTALVERHDYPAAESACDQLILRFKISENSELAMLAGRAMFNKIAIKAYLGNTDDVLSACDAFIDRFRYSTHPGICEMLFHAWSRKAAILEAQKSDADAVAAYDAAIKINASLTLPPVQVAAVMANRAACLGRLSRTPEQLAAYEDIIHRFADSGDRDVIMLLAPAMLARAFLLRADNRLDEALASCRQFIARIEHGTPPAMLVPLARAMFLRGELLEKLGQDRAAAEAYGTLAARFDFNGDTQSRQCIPIALYNQAALLEKLEQHDDALRVLDQLLQRAGNEPDLIPPQLVAQATRNRQAILNMLTGSSASPGGAATVAAEDRAAVAATANDHQESQPNPQSQMQTPSEQLAAPSPPQYAIPEMSLPTVPDTSESSPVSPELITPATEQALTTHAISTESSVHVPENTPPIVVAEVAHAPITNAAAAAQFAESDSPIGQLAHLRNIKWHGHSEELIAACDQFIKRNMDSESGAGHRAVAEAFRMKIEMLKEIGSLEDELRACNAFLLAFGRGTDSSLDAQICRTMLDQGRVFGQMDRAGHAAAVYDALIQRFAKSDDPAVRSDVIAALTRQAAIAAQHGRIGEEVRCYQRLVSKFGEVSATDVQREVARAMLNTGLAFRKLDRKLDELAVYDAIQHRFGNSEDAEILYVLARAMVRKSITLGERGRRQEQIKVCDAIIVRFANAESQFLRRQAARTQCNRAMALEELGQIPDAMAAYEQIIASFDRAVDSPLRACAGLALFQKAQLLRRQRRRAEAIACYQHFIQSYPMDDEEISGLISQSQALLRVL